MATIRFNGMASGLPPNIVDQLMDAERIPLKKMEANKLKDEDKLKLVGDFESKLNEITKQLTELTGAGGFMDKKLISGDPNIIDGLVDPQRAVPGEYQVEVLQIARKPSAISNGFSDKDNLQLGVGYLKFDTPEGTKEVYIKAGNSTLEGIVTQINQANIGVRAQVVNDRKDKENPYRLIVSGLNSGDDNEVEFPTVYMLDGDQDMFFDETLKAQNAKVKIDGFEVEIPANSNEELVPGVTLDIKQAAPGRPIRLTVKENLEVISGKIKSFVDAYNGALGFIQDQHKLKNSGGANPRMGPLGGDSLVRGVESALRRIIINPQYGVESPITRVSELGIEFNRNGTLNFKQDQFNKTLSANPQGVAAFLRGDGFRTGFIPTLKREVENITSSQFGSIGNRKKGIQSKIDQANQRIENKEKQLERKEEQLRKKFSDLEQKMSQLQSQGGAVAAMAQQGKQGG